MPKRVAIIDIGSNSSRVVIFQRTSRYGFHLIAQKKATVRVSEGSFINNGYLQEKAIERTINALKVFKTIIKDYKAKKVLAVATAAVRNAPNRYHFIKKVKEETGIKIKVIDGNKEAYFGAVAAKNLLPIDSETLTVDIGGGSTDMALIKNGKIEETLSLNLGTIKIKELFFDKKLDISSASEYIKNELKKIPSHFKGKQIVAIGGVLRTLTKSIMENSRYSFKKIHAFEYDFNKELPFIYSILNAKNDKDLKKLFIKESRFDTIKEGVLIFKLLLEQLKSSKVITSGVGIREGIFLHDMLRGSGGNFPKELNPSIVSITDRLDMLDISYKEKIKAAKKLYNILKEFIGKEDYQKQLIDAIKISNVGKTLTIYNEHKHAYYIASAELNWQYTHKDMLLIATIMRSKGDKLVYKPLQKEHEQLLPSKKVLKWLGFIYTLIDVIYSYKSDNVVDFEFKNKTLIVKSKKCSLPIFFDDIKNLKLPEDFKIELKA